MIFIDLDGNIIQYGDMCSHIGLANKLINENDALKDKYINSSYSRADLFLINDIGYISVSIDPIYGIRIIVNDKKINNIQRLIMNNYLKIGAKISFIEQGEYKNKVYKKSFN